MHCDGFQEFAGPWNEETHATELFHTAVYTQTVRVNVLTFNSYNGIRITFDVLGCVATDHSL